MPFRTLARFALFLALAAPAAHAQTPVDSTLAPFEFLVGTWQGPAHYTFPSGETRTVQQTEHVRPVLGGRMILIEGEGRRPGADGADGVVVFQAVGLLSHEAGTGRFPFAAYTADGHTETEMRVVGPGRLEWSYEVGGRSIRYTIVHDAQDRWVETGEVSADGDTWSPFFEMTLDRLAP